MNTINTDNVLCPICHSEARFDFSGRDLMFDGYTRYDYFSCTECSGIFQYPMPTADEIASFYPADYSVYDEKNHHRKLSQLKRAIYKNKYGYINLEILKVYDVLASLLARFYRADKPNYIENGTLLDVGCGNGRYLSTMRTLGWDVQGVDFSEDGIRVCRSADLKVHHGDLRSAQLPENYFDVITVRHVIEHIPEPIALMTELARLLKPGGKLIIDTPNGNSIGRSIFGANWYANDVPRHLILFSPDNLVRLAKEYGLKSESLILNSTPKIFLNSIDYIIKNTGKSSSKIRWRRTASRLYMWLARYTNRGDEIHSVFTK
ncbi:MAG TPA: class I SAM-dependent methyltransferase [Rhodospirillales bacterium]|nr:class I SAM-dependent methyltransferase [Rhodospirillales bacterium]HIL75409.1 class I SAM-dependent methyltransferase [Rhodospirillales bacterium]